MVLAQYRGRGRLRRDVLISKSIRVVQQAQTMIVERLGKYHKTLASGINFIPGDRRPLRGLAPDDHYTRRRQLLAALPYRAHRPARDRVRIPAQNVITKDNVVVEIDALIYSQVTDPVRATYEIANRRDAIEKLTQTTLRNVIGEMELDHVRPPGHDQRRKLRADPG